MATLFQQSALTFTVAQQKVAAAAGAKNDTAMLALAGDAITWAFQRWNTNFAWPWLLQSMGINLTAPINVALGGTTAGSNIISVPTGTAPVPVASLVIGSAGVLPESWVDVSSVDAQVTISQPAASTTTNQTFTFLKADYALPADFGKMYNVTLTGTPRPLIYTPQRDYDLARPLNTPSTPTHYTLFSRQGGEGTTAPVNALGYIRFLPPPTASNTGLLRYYRRLTQPVNGSDVLDIPQDYEVYFLAMAKAMFLADKGGNPDRMKFWAGMGELGLKRAIAETTMNPDDRTGFQPPDGAMSMAWNPNATTPYWTT